MTRILEDSDRLQKWRDQMQMIGGIVVGNCQANDHFGDGKRQDTNWQS